MNYSKLFGERGAIVSSFIMSCVFKCREDKENQIYWKQDHKQTQMITEYDKMVHFCVSRVLEGECKNQAH